LASNTDDFSISRLMEKQTDNLLINPFKDEASFFLGGDAPGWEISLLQQEIISAAQETVQSRSAGRLPTESEAIGLNNTTGVPSQLQGPTAADAPLIKEKDLQISLRLALRGVVVSLVDSAPSEIAVVTLKNVNSIASWNMQRTTDATVFVTVTSLQVDNMIPNAPFPVAICTEDGEAGISKGSNEFSVDSPPVLVIGLSFAPRHKTGIVVRYYFRGAKDKLALQLVLTKVFSSYTVFEIGYTSAA
jgi:hypothetical protein